MTIIVQGSKPKDRKHLLLREKRSLSAGDRVVFQTDGKEEEVTLTLVEKPEKGLQKNYQLISWAQPEKEEAS